MQPFFMGLCELSCSQMYSFGLYVCSRVRYLVLEDEFHVAVVFAEPPYASCFHPSVTCRCCLSVAKPQCTALVAVSIQSLYLAMHLAMSTSSCSSNFPSCPLAKAAPRLKKEASLQNCAMLRTC